MSEVIAIANQKGGVGKTMTSVSLSACLALNNKGIAVRFGSTRTFNKSIWIL